MISTLDVISNGRVRDRHRRRLEEGRVGGVRLRLPGDEGAARRPRRLARGPAGDARPGRATYEGTHACVRDAINLPKGLQQPRVPIMVGGNGPERTWRMAARVRRRAEPRRHERRGPRDEPPGHPRPMRGDRPRPRNACASRCTCGGSRRRTPGAERVERMAAYRELGVSRVQMLVRNAATDDDALAAFADDCRCGRRRDGAAADGARRQLSRATIARRRSPGRPTPLPRPGRCRHSSMVDATGPLSGDEPERRQTIDAAALREPPDERRRRVHPADEHAARAPRRGGARVVAQQHVVGRDLLVREVERAPVRQARERVGEDPAPARHPVALPRAALARASRRAASRRRWTPTRRRRSCSSRIALAGADEHEHPTAAPPHRHDVRRQLRRDRGLRLVARDDAWPSALHALGARPRCRAGRGRRRERLAVPPRRSRATTAKRSAILGRSRPSPSRREPQPRVASAGRRRAARCLEVPTELAPAVGRPFTERASARIEPPPSHAELPLDVAAGRPAPPVRRDEHVALSALPAADVAARGER